MRGVSGVSLRTSIYSFIFIQIFWVSVFAQDNKSYRLRDSSEASTPCGVYLSFMKDSTMGQKVADLTKESLDEFFAQNPDLGPRVVWVDRRSGKRLEKKEDLEKAFQNGYAKMEVDQPVLFGVGVPFTKKSQRAVADLIRRAARDRNTPNPVKIRILSRPKLERIDGPRWARPVLAAIEYGNYMWQETRYFFPSASLDYQPPVPAEKKSAYGKLMTANTVQQVVITAKAIASPELTIAGAIGGGIVNYSNSYGTGVYRKFINNWIMRANRFETGNIVGLIRNNVDQFARNLFLSSFFTVEIYWLSKMFEWDKLAAMGTAEGWYQMAVTKWSSAVMNVLWRFFYYKAIGGFETRMEKQGRKDDARRTAGRFEWLGTILGTPAFLVASMAPKDAGWIIPIVGDFQLQVTTAHWMMLAVGGLFAAFHVGIFKMEPWVERFDWIHEKVLKFARFLRLKKPVDRLERATREPYERIYRMDDPAAEEDRDEAALAEMEAQRSQIKEQMGLIILDHLKMDPAVERVFEENPELKRLAARDLGLWKALSEMEFEVPLNRPLPE